MQSDEFDSSGTGGLLFEEDVSENAKTINLKSFSKLFTLELPQGVAKKKTENLSQKEKE